MDEKILLIINGRRVRVPMSVWDLLAGPKPRNGYICNGAGPDRLGPGRIGRALGWIVNRLVPDEIHGWNVGIAAAIHDHEYGLGGNWTDRRRADWNLARNIVTVISEAECFGARASLSAPRVFLIATLYWLGVRLGGWAAFNYATGQGPRGRAQRLRERLGLFRDNGKSRRRRAA